ncbi:GspE/PulE family protein [Photobacterium leiognathi]|uniref:GspE/PulE family protein n=1 Tax=Photobacterium leiognathi TaxID=553611 RepID=UPI002981D0FB|nr:ATPase, T2SS/T4P/T4SS family [Photobacterium leiognathi]
MSKQEALSVLITDPALIRLCLDDGSTFVTSEGEIKTANPQAPKLDDIAQYVKAMPFMTGKDVVINQTSVVEVNIAIDIMTQSGTVESGRGKDTAVGALLSSLCQSAVDRGTSDIHVEVDGELTRFLIRVDGRREVLERFADGSSALHQPRKTGTSLATYVFATLGGQDIKLRDPANDRFALPLNWQGETKLFEWRAALIPLDNGIKLTLRCLTSRDKALSLEDMDLPLPYLTVLREMIQKRSGAIVICGPMGSGKSSLVTALIETIDRTARCVHALEDPVEFKQSMVSKTTVEPKKETKLGEGRYRDYAFYAVETLRHDVDVPVLGEVREYAAAKEFCRKAETGGLAITTLHTNSALGVPQTFIQQLNIPAAIVGAPGLMLMFVHQKLVRKLCPHCALPIGIEAETIYDAAGHLAEYRKKKQQLQTLLPDAVNAQVKHPGGCKACSNKGEKGRLVVMEIIVLDDIDRQYIAKEDDHGWKQHLINQGWPDIREHTLSRIKNGQVDIASASEQVDGLMPVDIKNIYADMQEAL